MKGTLYINDDPLGVVDFRVIDEGMGGIGETLEATTNYKKYRTQIQDLYDRKGIANIEDFNFRIILVDNTLLEPTGGIGVTDSSEFDEITVDSAGIDSKIVERIKNE